MRRSIEHSASGSIITPHQHSSSLVASGHSVVGSTLDCASSATNSYAASANDIHISEMTQNEDEPHLEQQSSSSLVNSSTGQVYDDEQDERLGSILEATEVIFFSISSVKP